MKHHVAAAIGTALLLGGTRAAAEFPSGFPTNGLIYLGTSESGEFKTYIDQSPYRNDDSVGGAVTLLFSSEQTHPSGRHYWAERKGFSGHCNANTIGESVASGYEDQGGVIQFSDDLPNPPPPLEEHSVDPKTVEGAVLKAACGR